MSTDKTSTDQPATDEATHPDEDGYTGTAAGLHDPNTNLTYAVRYLAGAYRAANGNADRAVHYYAAGYYYAAKRQRRHHAGHHDAQARALQAGTPLSILPPQ